MKRALCLALFRLVFAGCDRFLLIGCCLSIADFRHALKRHVAACDSPFCPSS